MNAFTDFAALETTLNPILDPAIYVEPKDKDPRLEDPRQAEWVKFMRQHARACLVFAVPNGTNIATRSGRAKVKREGLYTGFPDAGCVWAEVTAFIEWKSGKGDLSGSQIEALNWLHLRGHPVAVVRTLVGCVAWLRSIGAPVPLINNQSRRP